MSSIVKGLFAVPSSPLNWLHIQITPVLFYSCIKHECSDTCYKGQS